MIDVVDNAAADFVGREAREAARRGHHPPRLHVGLSLPLPPLRKRAPDTLLLLLLKTGYMHTMNGVLMGVWGRSEACVRWRERRCSTCTDSSSLRAAVTARSRRRRLRRDQVRAPVRAELAGPQ